MVTKTFLVPKLDLTIILISSTIWLEKRRILGGLKRRSRQQLLFELSTMKHGGVSECLWWRHRVQRFFRRWNRSRRRSIESIWPSRRSCRSWPQSNRTEIYWNNFLTIFVCFTQLKSQIAKMFTWLFAVGLWYYEWFLSSYHHCPKIKRWVRVFVFKSFNPNLWSKNLVWR